MAVYGGPDIVTDGLVTCLDAFNSKSYPGSGNTWFDLSGNGRNGTIFPRTDGFTVSEKYLTFPDTSSYPTRPATYAYVRTNIDTGAFSYTANVFVRTRSSTEHLFRTSNNFGMDIDVTNKRVSGYTTEFNVERFATPNNTFFVETWQLVSLVYDRDNLNQKIYINGILRATKNHTVQYNLGTSYINWLSRNDAYLAGLNGDCGMISFYTRALSETELLNNYNAIKGRYGL